MLLPEKATGAVVGDDALVDRAVAEIELAGGVDQHGAVGGQDLVGQGVGIEQQLGGGLAPMVPSLVKVPVPLPLARLDTCCRR